MVIAGAGSSVFMYRKSCCFRSLTMASIDKLGLLLISSRTGITLWICWTCQDMMQYFGLGCRMATPMLQQLFPSSVSSILFWACFSISCHRETNVNVKDNGYYTKIHEELSKKYGVDKLTAAHVVIGLFTSCCARNISPKKRLGLCSALASTPPLNILPCVKNTMFHDAEAGGEAPIAK